MEHNKNKYICQTHVYVDQQLKMCAAGMLSEHCVKSALTDWQA